MSRQYDLGTPDFRRRGKGRIIATGSGERPKYPQWLPGGPCVCTERIDDDDAAVGSCGECDPAPLLYELRYSGPHLAPCCDTAPSANLPPTNRFQLTHRGGCSWQSDTFECGLETDRYWELVIGSDYVTATLDMGDGRSLIYRTKRLDWYCLGSNVLKLSPDSTVDCAQCQICVKAATPQGANCCDPFSRQNLIANFSNCDAFTGSYLLTENCDLGDDNFWCGESAAIDLGSGKSATVRVQLECVGSCGDPQVVGQIAVLVSGAACSGGGSAIAWHWQWVCDSDFPPFLSCDPFLLAPPENVTPTSGACSAEFDCSAAEVTLTG